MDSRSLTPIADGPIIDQLNAAWLAEYPHQAQPLVPASLNDDGMLRWFSNGDRTELADQFATAFLQRYAGSGTGADGRAKSTDIAKRPVAYRSADLRKFYAGPAAAQFVGTSAADTRVPDLIGVVQHGAVYTSKTKKIAEHGGDDPRTGTSRWSCPARGSATTPSAVRSRPPRSRRPSWPCTPVHSSRRRRAHCNVARHRGTAEPIAGPPDRATSRSTRRGRTGAARSVRRSRGAAAGRRPRCWRAASSGCSRPWTLCRVWCAGTARRPRPGHRRVR